MKKVMFLSLIALLIAMPTVMNAQSVIITSIYTPGTEPATDPNDVLSPDAMTTATRTGMANPDQGLLVFDTDLENFWYYDNNSWVQAPYGSIVKVNGTKYFLKPDNEDVHGVVL